MTAQPLADRILSFQKSLRISAKLPKGVTVMNPYLDSTAVDLCKKFYHKFYDDENPRILMLGINPGRFGGGITGIPFTDPLKLEKACAIPNSLTKKAELSADFIYTMIEAFGGPSAFYGRFYIGAVCPLGFTKAGRNMNYYDDKKLETALAGFITTCLEVQLSWGLDRRTCYCLGEGRNFHYLSELNKRKKYFAEIVPLAHPRFIMQYRRKKINDYIQAYLWQLKY